MLSVVTMEAGWVVTEVGRQPWIVHDYMKVEEAATANTGVWITFLAVSAIYAVLGVTTILVLRGMSRRWREQGEVDETDVPYGPSDPGIVAGERGPVDEHDQRDRRWSCSSGSPRTRCSAAPTSAPGSGTSSPAARTRGERPRALIDHSIGPVWEANHVWLIFCLVVLWTAFAEAFSSIMLTLFVPLTLAAFGIVLRGSSFAFRKVVLRTRDRRNFGAAFATSSVLVPYCMGAVAGAIASGRVPVGRRGRRPLDELDQPHVGRRRAARDRGVRVPRRRCTSCGTRTASVTSIWPSTSGGGRSRASVVAGAIAAVGIVVFHSDAHYLFDGLTSRALPLVIVSGVCGIASLVLLFRNAPSWARVFSIGAVATVVIGWGVAQWPYMLPETLEGVAGRGAVGHARRGDGRVRGRGRHDPALARPALRPRPEEPARGRGRGRRGHGALSPAIAAATARRTRTSGSACSRSTFAPLAAPSMAANPRTA